MRVSGHSDMTCRRGFTLIEVLCASLIASIVAGGTMMAFVTAARIKGRQSSTTSVEATQFAQETLEKYRNYVAVDSTFLSDKADTNTWYPDLLPSSGSDSESILKTGAKRCFRVDRKDCNADGTVDPDCYQIQVKVCWNGGNCPC